MKKKTGTWGRRIGYLTLLLGIFVALLLPSYADKKYSVEINRENIIDRNHVKIIDGNTFVHAEEISEHLHLDYYWQVSTKTMYLSQIKDGKEIIMAFIADESSGTNQKDAKHFSSVEKLNLSPEAVVLERKKVLLRGFNLEKAYQKIIVESNYVEVDGEIFLPLRTISDTLNYNLAWDSQNKLIQLRTVEESLLPKRFSYTEEEFMLMAKLLQVEARSGSINKKLAVANVILNRVESPRFPNSIKEVIYARGQFPPVFHASFASVVPSNEALQAAKMALENERAEMNGIKMPENVFFFNNAPFSSKSQREFFGLIEGDYFYY